MWAWVNSLKVCVNRIYTVLLSGTKTLRERYMNVIVYFDIMNFNCFLTLMVAFIFKTLVLSFQFPPEVHEHVQFFIDICNNYGRDQGYILLWGMFWKPIIVTCSPSVVGKICKSNGERSL